MKRLISSKISKLIFVALLFNTCAVSVMHAAAEEPKKLETEKGRLDKVWQRLKRCIAKRECSKADVAAITGVIVTLIALVSGGMYLKFGRNGWAKKLIDPSSGDLKKEVVKEFIQSIAPSLKEGEKFVAGSTTETSQWRLLDALTAESIEETEIQDDKVRFVIVGSTFYLHARPDQMDFLKEIASKLKLLGLFFPEPMALKMPGSEVQKILGYVYIMAALKKKS